MAQKKSSNRKKAAGAARPCSKTKSCKAPAKAASSSSNKGMKVTTRIVDARRHTKGYMVGGKKHTVAQVRKLAKSGRIRGVQVVGNHIQALPGQPRLTDLPMKIM